MSDATNIADRLRMLADDWHPACEEGAKCIEQQAARIAELEACSAAAASAEPFGWVKPAGGNYFTRSALSARRIGGLVPVYAAPVADSAMAKDAERYRWLRNPDPQPVRMLDVCNDFLSIIDGDELDEAIDAAIAASAEKTTGK